MLYPGLPPATSKKNLRQSLYELRQLLAAQSSAGGAADIGTGPPLLLAARQQGQAMTRE